ncbi:hypothetical protein Tco_0408607 [Tanacetum coccineum]
MAAVEVPQTLEYRGGQLNAAPVLEMKNFTNWKKRFMCHIIGIEPQFEKPYKRKEIPIVNNTNGSGNLNTNKLSLTNHTTQKTDAQNHHPIGHSTT